ncbi:MAG: DUF4426 domain-containing protein [Pontibacterium sp.]
MKTLFNFFARLSVLAALSAGLTLSSAQAEQFVAFDNYEIHYNAFNSRFVTPKVAQANGLQRSKRQAMVNVSVLKVEPDGQKKAVAAFVSGTASNLLQQTQTLAFKKIDEGKAIYYIGQFGFSDDMMVRIDLQVQPDPNKAAYTLKLEQRFYAD